MLGHCVLVVVMHIDIDGSRNTGKQREATNLSSLNPKSGSGVLHICRLFDLICPCMEYIV